MQRSAALDILRSNVKNKNLVKHMIASEACMAELARHFGEDVETWALTGLLHDIDYDKTANDPGNHGRIALTILKPYGLDERILYAIQAHPGLVPAKNRMDWALYAVDPLTGLIVAACLMHPDKKLASLDVDFIIRRFNEKRFAAGANRDQIARCRELGLSLEEFTAICLRAMQQVNHELEL